MLRRCYQQKYSTRNRIKKLNRDYKNDDHKITTEHSDYYRKYYNQNYYNPRRKVNKYYHRNERFGRGRNKNKGCYKKRQGWKNKRKEENTKTIQKWMKRFEELERLVKEKLEITTEVKEEEITMEIEEKIIQEKEIQENKERQEEEKQTIIEKYEEERRKITKEFEEEIMKMKIKFEKEKKS
ncbi:hypothetical protein, conserved [Entamoeba histolytica]